MSAEAFHELQACALYGVTIAHPRQAPEPGEGSENRECGLPRRMEDLRNLPAMPTMLEALLAIRNEPRAGAKELAAIIETDPSLTAQLLRYARSPLYGYRGAVISVRQAIGFVLGFDLALNMALGIALGMSFKGPAGGPLGLNGFWVHALYTAAIAERLAERLPEPQRPDSGLTYLAGLLHDLGLLVEGQCCPEAVKAVNRRLARDRTLPLPALEAEYLGTDHMDVGAWLADRWRLPEEVRVAMLAHHDPDYDGPHAVYARLVLVADRLQQGYDLGDAETEEIPPALLDALGLDQDALDEVLQDVVEGRAQIESMALQMAA